LDRRILKTREDIRNAFIVLLKEKIFDEITVKDIAEKANINRATFYKHYDDKYDLIAYLEEGIIEKIKGIIEASSPINLTLAIQEQPAFQTIVDIYLYINEERDLIEVLVSSNGNQSFLTHMQFLLEQMLMNHFNQINTTKQSAMKLELIVVYLASAHLGVIKHWLIKKLRYTPEEMAVMLIKILRDGPVAMLTSLSKY
jgi:AcrR family transcriptional regulator